MFRAALITLAGGLCLVLLACSSSSVGNRQVNYARPLESPGQQFGKVPPAVQNTIRAQTGSSEISQIFRLTSGTGNSVYAVFFVNPGPTTLYVAPDGSVLADDFSTVVGAPGDETESVSGSGHSTLTEQDLPEKVKRALRESDPKGRVATIEKQPWGETTAYVISFDDPARHSRLYIQADGTVLKKTSSGF